MTRYDVIVIGLTRVGAAVADAAAAAGRKVAVVHLSEADDEADRLSYALESLTPPQPGPVRFDVIASPAAFLNRDTLSAGGTELTARRFVLAVGGHPRFPDGLDGVALSSPLDVLTAGAGRPAQAVVLGGGPVAALVADRLEAAGAKVTIAARSPRLLPKEDESVSDTLTGRFRARGIAVNTSVTALAIAPRAGGFHARFCCGGDNQETQADAVVAATGLAPSLSGLALEKAGVLTRDGRVVVNDEMRTSNPKIFAAGHGVEPGAPLAIQDHQADIVAENLSAPFWARRRLEPGELPFCLRTTPAVARLGLTEAQARERHGDVVTASAPYFDGPVTDGATAPGMIKLVARRRRSQLLGVHIVGQGAAELVLFFDILMRAEIPLVDVPARPHFPLPGPTDAAYRALHAWAAATDQP